MHIKDFDPYDFSKKEIEGVTVYYKNLPWAPCIHTRFTFSVGSFNDPEGKEGVAHFLEHMMFDGSPSLPTKKDIDEFSRLYMLKSHNATTGYNWTSYHGKFLPEHFATVLKMFAEQVSQPLLKDEDVEHERKVITQEAWGRFKNEKLLKYIKEMVNILYSKHVRGHFFSPLGWPETVAKITQKDIKDFHKKYYVKENLSILLVGAVEEKHVDMLGDFLKTIPSGGKAILDEGEMGKPLQNRIEKNSEEIGDPQEQLEFTIMRVLGKQGEQEEYAGREAVSLLYDALFERLRTEKSLCYGVNVGNRSYKSFSEYIISVKTSEEKLELAEKEIWNILEEIIDGKWKDRFVLIHKLIIDTTRSRERLSSDIIQNSSNDLVNGERIETLEEIIENHGRVKYEDVVSFIKKTFTKDDTLTEVIYPAKKA
ncbi:MAG: pitrilysin family protein [Nitrospira sp.]